MEWQVNQPKLKSLLGAAGGESPGENHHTPAPLQTQSIWESSSQLLITWKLRAIPVVKVSIIMILCLVALSYRIRGEEYSVCTTRSEAKLSLIGVVIIGHID